jgi:molecular chaperone GrpE (heat shock protein)
LAEKDLSFFAVAIEEAFGLMDIESVGASASELFDSSKHHAARIVPSDDPDLDKRIERVLRQGFTYAGAPRVFLPAHVSVFRYQPPPPVEADELVVEEDSQPQLETGEGASNE